MYTKFQKLTRWQKFRLLGVSVFLMTALVFIAGVIAGLICTVFMWGFNLLA